MLALILNILLMCQFQIGNINPENPVEILYPTVITNVDTISVAVMEDGSAVLFFWDIVQGEFDLLDYKWHDTNRFLGERYDIDGVHILFMDDVSSCFRIVHSKYIVLTKEKENPAFNQKPWFARNNGMKVGLGEPKK